MRIEGADSTVTNPTAADGASAPGSVPAPGWSAFVLILGMVVIVTVALDAPAWVLGESAWTDFLPVAAVLGAILTVIGSRLHRGYRTVHVLVAIAGGLVLPVLTGWAVQPGASLPEAFSWTARGVVSAWIDLGWRGQPTTVQMAHHVLGLGIVAWSIGQSAAGAVFLQHRAGNAAAVPAVVLLVNMTLARQDQLLVLVAFSACSLLLFATLRDVGVRRAWASRPGAGGEPSRVPGLVRALPTTVVFIGVALLLASNASSRPLAGAFKGIEPTIASWADELQGWLPRGGDSGITGVRFGERAIIEGRWTPDASIAFTARFPAREREKFYWRAVTYDLFEHDAWRQSTTRDIGIPAGGRLTEYSAEVPAPGASRALEISVEPASFAWPTVVSPATPDALDGTATIRLAGMDGYFVELLREGAEPYTVAAKVPKLGDGGVTATALRGAGRDYPGEVIALFTAYEPDDLGPAATALRDKIVSTARSDAPYDLAVAFERYLRDDTQFTYDTDIRDLDCTEAGTVECFARERRGYCQQYATTMTVLLRSLGIPARFVQGFLPGERRADGVELVSNSRAHAWVEVYFPGYAWQVFDPTGGGIAQAERPPEGSVASPAASPGTSPAASPAASGRAEIDRTEPDGGRVGGTTPRGADPMWPLLIAAVALLGVVVAARSWRQRHARQPFGIESTWASIERLAARLGAPRGATQTVYEYVTTLSGRVPRTREDLSMVAAAKVEAAYGRRTIAGERAVGVRRAASRIRRTLLTLVVRRGRAV